MQNLHLFNKLHEQMERKLLRLLPVAAVLLMASCTDDQYDLSEIDTTSEFAVNGLVVPLNMAPIKLDAIIAIDEDDPIKKDENGNFYFEKRSEEDFSFEDVNVEKITIKKPNDISELVTISVNEDIKNKWTSNAPNSVFSDIWGIEEMGITNETEIINVKVEDTHNINLEASGIDDHIINLRELGVVPVTLNIDIKLQGLTNVVNHNPVTIKDLTVNLPWGMTVVGNGNYNPVDGKLTYDELPIVDGRKIIELTVTAFNYEKMHEDGANFDVDTHTFKYNKACSATGNAIVKAEDLYGGARVSDLTSAENATYSCDVYFSQDMVVNKFSGEINYKIDGIDIDPVDISDLPDILNDSGTDLVLDNPQLYLDINNPLQPNNVTATADLRITRMEKDKPLPAFEKKGLTFDAKMDKKVLSPKDPEVQGYTHVPFAELKDLLRGKDENGVMSVPDSLEIKILNPVLQTSNVKGFELGKKHSITGGWRFYTDLALTAATKIVYSKVWDDWQSDDLDGLTVEKAIASFTVKNEVAFDADEVKFTLMGKGGKELWGSTTLKGDKEQPVTITMEGGPVTNVTGGKLNVKLKGNGNVLNKDKEIVISNLRLTVYGHYDKEF